MGNFINAAVDTAARAQINGGAITPTSINGVPTDSGANKPVTAASLAGGTLPASVTTLSASGEVVLGTIGTTGVVITNNTNTFAAPSVSFRTADVNLPIAANFYNLNALNDTYILLQGRGGDGAVFGQNGRASALPIEGYVGTLLADGITFNKAMSWGTTGLVTARNGLAVTGAISATATIKTGGYTVATLPAGNVGLRTYVTDANVQVWGGGITGGGSNVYPVFYNGSGWVAG